MPQYLRVEAISLRELLSGRYRFVLPWFQRAYGWTDVQAGRLLVDMIAACNERECYPIGCIFLAAPPDQPNVSLIDGHQRLITLTILFALLRDMVADAGIRQSADGTIANRSGSNIIKRIEPQPNVAEFFETHVQRPGGTQAEPPGDIMQLTDSERNILANRNHLRKRIAEDLPDEAGRVRLVRYMLERCLVTVQSVANEDDAWTIVSTEEETHVAFHSSERSKVTLISGMPRQEQEAAGRIYERSQGLIGPDDMCRLLSHIRAIKLRKRSSKPIEKDLMQQFALNRGGLAFLEKEVKPRSELMARIKRRRLADGAAGVALAPRLETLSWLDNQFWMPPLLHWLTTVAAEHPSTLRFIELVDRLAWTMKIAGVDPIDQEKRLLRLLGEIDSGVAPDAMKELRIEPRLHAGLIENLLARTFYAKRYCGLVLRRIHFNINAAADRGPVDGDRVTIEHVLPRKPRAGSDWWRSFTTAEMVSENVNRLGNLLFLTLEENQKVSRNDWAVKRDIIAQSEFVLSRPAAVDNEAWTRETIDKRTAAMIGALLRPWQLTDPAGLAA